MPTRIHTNWRDMPISRRWDLSPLQKECSYCFKETEKNPLYCIPATLWDILAIKKRYMRTQNPPQLIKGVRMYTRRQDDIMAFGMRRQFAAWMPAPAQAGGGQWRWLRWNVPLWESQAGTHADSQTRHLLCTRRRVALIKTEWRIHTQILPVSSEPECSEFGPYWKALSLNPKCLPWRFLLSTCICLGSLCWCMMLLCMNAFCPCWKCAFVNWHHRGVL